MNQRRRIVGGFESRLSKKNLLQIRRGGVAISGLQLRSLQSLDCKFALPKILQTAIRMKIGRAQAGKMSRWLAAHENSGAVDRHPAPRYRQVPAFRCIQFGCALTRNEPKKIFAPDYVVNCSTRG